MEIFPALTSEMGFEGYEMVEDRCEGYLPFHLGDRPFFERVQEIAEQLGLSLRTHFMADRNWNAEWESNFEPLVVEDKILVKATFHDVRESYPYTLVISPKMAFGTGHHETTYMMLRAMLEMDWEGHSVLDYGSGTGILSVAARMLGSGPVTAVDIQPEAASNAEDHIRLNKVDRIAVLTGDITAVPAGKYEVILANINRNVILDTLPDMVRLLDASGTVLISGILKEDRKRVLERAYSVGLSLSHTLTKGNWLCFKMHL